MPKPTLATLFPSKKKQLQPPPKPKAAPSPSGSSPSPSKPRPPRPKSAPRDDDSDETLKLPAGPYQEFRLMSSALNGWKYDVMKFDSHKVVDISTWQTPIKLNRKDLRKPGDDAVGEEGPTAVGPMVGPDGKPVIGADGRMVMVDAEGRPIHPGNNGPKGKGAANGAGAAPAKKRFQKKTRQVFLVSEEVRQLRREERYPWVIEDSSGKETWVAKLEEVAQAETRAFFMPAANDVFKFVPAHRWYKFQKKPLYTVWSAEEAEAIYQKHKNNLSPEVWLSRRKGTAMSAATAATFKAEAEGRVIVGENSLVEAGGTSLGPGGRKLKTVENGMDHLFEEDGEEGDTAKRRKARELGEDGDMDEIVFEEDFADDEEPMEVDDNDEEAKEQAERIKREQKAANKTREGYVDADDDEEEGALSKDGKRFKKMLRNRDGNEAYDSDDEDNPYASSAEEEEEEQLVPGSLVDPAMQPKTESRPGSQPPGIPPTPQPNGDTAVKEESPISPTTPNLSLGGHSVVAKRATSPKAPKLKSTPGSRAGSPLASRGSSPTASATPNIAGSRATSPGAADKANNKRKAEDGASPPASGGPPKPKKRKAHPGVGTPVGELEDKMVIEWLRNTQAATTRDCIAHFTPYLTDEAKKSKFTTLVKEIATLKNGMLVLRNAYRNPSAAPSPAPTPAA